MCQTPVKKKPRTCCVLHQTRQGDVLCQVNVDALLDVAGVGLGHCEGRVVKLEQGLHLDDLFFDKGVCKGEGERVCEGGGCFRDAAAAAGVA